MKYNININQLGLEGDKDITLVEASVIDWIHTFCGANNYKINKQKIDGWTWISCQYLIDDMPLLRIKTRSGGSKLLTRLEKLGYIEIKREPKKLFIRPTVKLDTLYTNSGYSKKKTVSSSIPNSVPQDTYTNTNNDTDNNTIIQEDKLPEKEEFSHSKELEKLQNSDNKYNKILALYFYRKGFNFQNKLQFNTEYKRNIKVARELMGYNSKQIEDTMEFCEEKWSGVWTLETVLKRINSVIANGV